MAKLALGTAGACDLFSRRGDVSVFFLFAGDQDTCKQVYNCTLDVLFRLAHSLAASLKISTDVEKR